MTDRELLEMAAKAAGYDINWDGIGWQWNPLTDDGDALRLTVKLGIDISKSQVDYWDKNSTDPYAATRRAIVRAAAEIGKEKP